MKVKATVEDIRQLVAEIDVTDQKQIDDLKALYPGQGVGPSVQEKLSGLITSGEIKNPLSIPEEYEKQLSPLFG